MTFKEATAFERELDARDKAAADEKAADMKMWAEYGIVLAKIAGGFGG